MHLTVVPHKGKNRNVKTKFFATNTSLDSEKVLEFFNYSVYINKINHFVVCWQ